MRKRWASAHSGLWRWDSRSLPAVTCWPPPRRQESPGYGIIRCPYFAILSNNRSSKTLRDLTGSKPPSETILTYLDISWHILTASMALIEHHWTLPLHGRLPNGANLHRAHRFRLEAATARQQQQPADPAADSIHNQFDSIQSSPSYVMIWIMS